MYDHGKEYLRVPAVTFSLGIKATFTAGLVPMKLRSIAVVVTTQMTVTPPVLTPKFRPTAGSAAGEVNQATLTVPLARVPGEVVYKKNYDLTIAPGQNLVLEVTTAATAGAGDIVAEFEPNWENIANNTKAFASA
jgi:hypothetical protein